MQKAPIVRSGLILVMYRRATELFMI